MSSKLLLYGACLAAYLKFKLASATWLVLGVDFLRHRISQGTMTTIVEAESIGGLVRQNGVLAPVAITWKRRTIDYPNSNYLFSYCS